MYHIYNTTLNSLTRTRKILNPNLALKGLIIFVEKARRGKTNKISGSPGLTKRKHYFIQFIPVCLWVRVYVDNLIFQVNQLKGEIAKESLQHFLSISSHLL